MSESSDKSLVFGAPVIYRKKLSTLFSASITADLKRHYVETLDASDSSVFLNAIIEYTKALFGLREDATRRYIIYANTNSESVRKALKVLEMYYDCIVDGGYADEYYRAGNFEAFEFVVNYYKMERAHAPLSSCIAYVDVPDLQSIDGKDVYVFSLPAHREALKVFHQWLTSELGVMTLPYIVTYNSEDYVISYGTHTTPIGGANKRRLLEKLFSGKHRRKGLEEGYFDDMNWRQMRDAAYGINKECKKAFGIEKLLNASDSMIKIDPAYL